MSKKKKVIIPSKPIIAVKPPVVVKSSRHLPRRILIVLTKITLVVVWMFFSSIGLGNSKGFTTYIGVIGLTLLFGFLVYFAGDLYDKRET